MRQHSLLVALLSSTALGGCAANQTYNPFVAAPVTVKSLRTIAVTSTEVPKGLRDRTTVQQQFDAALAAELQAAGYQVIPAAQVDPVWRSLSDSAKLYDPTTGELDEAKLSALLRTMSREVSGRFGADAWLLSDFRVRPARYESGWCQWDGTKQYIQTKGELLKLGLLGVRKSGHVPALSIRVVISDTIGHELYRNHGGVGALVRMTARGSEDVGREEILADSARNARAVQLALAPLAKPRQ